jgi:hypothetical protein
MSIPGVALRSHDTSKILVFLRKFVSAYPSVRCTRLDLALDDFSKSLSPLTLIDAIERGWNKGFRKSLLVCGIGQGVRLSDGWTLSMGSRESDKYYRYYNKDAESKGLIPSFRLELEAKGELSEKLFQNLLQYVSNDVLGRIISDYITGGLDFRIGSDKNLERLTRCDFWSEWLALIEAFPVAVRNLARVSSIARKISWIESQAANSLYLIARALSPDGFVSWIEDLMLHCNQRNKKNTEFLVDEFVSTCSMV